ncbi:hypothetical protein AB0C59_00560 [Streptomyces sp. NPDC048664]|uniref:hypothetical protein n=1 Tax=Streptomyces sp. NPDC048664 TaxID=3154505 RepID=UPI00343F5B59
MSDHPEQSPLPDDVWERFAQDSERDIRASAPKEPSARARMVTERLRRQDELGIRPDAWRAPAATAGRRTRRTVWTVAGVLVAAAVAVVAMRPSLLPGDPFGTGSAAGADTAPLPAESARPTAPPPSAAADTPTLRHPFAGSPAQGWAEGASAIAMPTAEPVGTMTSSQVATALRQTRTLLVDANLDPATLLGKRPTAALGVLDPQQPKLLPGLNRSLDAPTEKDDPLLLFTRFDPQEVRLVGDAVKVRGRTTVSAGDHAVRVHADYTFVYALTRGDSGEVARTIVRRVIDTEVADPTRVRVTPGRIQLIRYESYHGNTACGVHDGFLHPGFPTADPSGTPATGPTSDPYDSSRDLSRTDSATCGTVSRT